ncbi:hypothetical protein [Streptomyces lavendulae]|uniref:hypothetical protein n=1 Tax=Streptomyces lavendulae TaxID=1914 RepID=UPI00340A1150
MIPLDIRDRALSVVPAPDMVGDCHIREDAGFNGYCESYGVRLYLVSGRLMCAEHAEKVTGIPAGRLETPPFDDEEQMISGDCKADAARHRIFRGAESWAEEQDAAGRHIPARGWESWAEEHHQDGDEFLATFRRWLIEREWDGADWAAWAFEDAPLPVGSVPASVGRAGVLAVGEQPEPQVEFPGVLGGGESAEHMGAGVWRVTYREGFTYELTPAPFHPGEYGVGRVLEDGTVRGWGAIFDDTSITPAVKWTRLESKTLAETHAFQARYGHLHEAEVPFSLELTVEELEAGRVWHVTRFGRSGVLVLQGWGYALLTETGDFPETPNRKYIDGKRWRYAIQCIVGGMGNVSTDRMRLVEVDRSGEPCAVNGHDAGQSCESGKRNKAFSRFTVEVTGPDGEIAGTVPVCAKCWTQRALGEERWSASREAADIAWRLSEGKGSWVDWQDRSQDLTSQLLAAALDAGAALPDIRTVLYAEALVIGDQRAAKAARAAAAKAGAGKVAADAVCERVLAQRAQAHVELIAWSEAYAVAWTTWVEAKYDLEGEEREAFPEFVAPVKPGPAVEVAADDTSYSGEDDDQDHQDDEQEEHGESTVMGRGSKAPRKVKAVRVGDIVFSDKNTFPCVATLNGHAYVLRKLAGLFSAQHEHSAARLVFEGEDPKNRCRTGGDSFPNLPALKRAILADAVERGPVGVQRQDQPEREPDPVVEAGPWGPFERGQIVTVDGEEGMWTLMAHAQNEGVWQAEPATLRGGERREFSVSALTAKTWPDGAEDWQKPVDAAGREIRLGDLVVQDFFEQTTVREVTRIYQNGNWLAHAVQVCADGRRDEFTEQTNRLRVVTREQLAAHVDIDLEDGGHQGRIVSALASNWACQFRVLCTCGEFFDWEEVTEPGRSRKIAWRKTLGEAQALWAEHCRTHVQDDADQAPEVTPGYSVMQVNPAGDKTDCTEGMWWAHCNGGREGCYQYGHIISPDADTSFRETQEAARALGEWHFGGEQGPAPTDRFPGQAEASRVVWASCAYEFVYRAECTECDDAKEKFTGGKGIARTATDKRRAVRDAAVEWTAEHAEQHQAAESAENSPADGEKILVQGPGSAGESVEVPELADTAEIPVKPEPTPGLYAPTLHTEERTGDVADECREGGHRYVWLVIEAEGVARILRSYLTCECSGEKLGNFGRSGPSMNQGTQTKPLGIRDASIASALGVAKRNSYTTKGPWEIVSDTLKRCSVEWDHAKAVTVAVDPNSASQRRRSAVPEDAAPCGQPSAWRIICGAHGLFMPRVPRTLAQIEKQVRTEMAYRVRENRSQLTRKERRTAHAMLVREYSSERTDLTGYGKTLHGKQDPTPPVVRESESIRPMNPGWAQEWWLFADVYGYGFEVSHRNAKWSGLARLDEWQSEDGKVSLPGKLLRVAKEPCGTAEELLNLCREMGEKRAVHDAGTRMVQRVVTQGAEPVEVAAAVEAPAAVLPSTGRGYWEIGERVIFEGRAGRVVSATIGKTLVEMDGAEPGYLEHLEPRDLVAERYVVCGGEMMPTMPERPVRDWFAAKLAPAPAVEEDGPDYAAISRANHAAVVAEMVVEEDQEQPLEDFPAMDWESLTTELAELRTEACGGAAFDWDDVAAELAALRELAAEGREEAGEPALTWAQVEQELAELRQEAVPAAVPAPVVRTVIPARLARESLSLAASAALVTLAASQLAEVMPVSV